MLAYIRQRFFIAIPLLAAISIVSFGIILLPPGSYVETYIQRLEQQGFLANESVVEQLYRQYGLDRGPVEQYFLWMTNFLLRGEMGRSFIYEMPVTEIIMERLPLSIAFTLVAFAFTWIIAIPIGIYSAVRQYSITDYLATTVSFIGLAIPSFLLALAGAYVVFVYTGHAITSLYSLEFRNAPWSWAKLVDMAKNAWLGVLVIAVAGTGQMVRILRSTLLDELKKLYVITARAKGLRESRVIFKYPVRIAFNPLISTIGWMLPTLVSGEVIVARVLGLETLGPVLLEAALSEDMYLVGSIVMILSALVIIGTLISDILLAVIDPRIRLGRSAG